MVSLAGHILVSDILKYQGVLLLYFWIAKLFKQSMSGPGMQTANEGKTLTFSQ